MTAIWEDWEFAGNGAVDSVFPQRLKPQLFLAFAVRLKSCPF